MGSYIVVPKRKSLPPPLRDSSGNVINMELPLVLPPNFVFISPQALSALLIDTNKDWATFSIENIGKPSDNLGATRKYDILASAEFVIDGGGVAITTGQKGHIRLPFAGTIISAALAADVSGSIVVDIWKDTYANFPPTNADSITASAPPTISSAQKDLDTTLSGWTTAFVAGDFLAFNVDSCTTITRVTLTLTVRRT